MLERLFLLFFIISYAVALYEDQIGKFDWRQQYIGEVKAFSLDKGSSSSRQLFAATKQNVVAAISLRNGELVWRQIMEEGGKLQSFAHCDSTVVTLTQFGSTIVRAWNTALGHLQWEYLVSEADNMSVDMICDDNKRQIFVIFGKNLLALDMIDGSELWNKEISAITNMASIRLSISHQKNILISGLKPGISLTYVTVSNTGSVVTQNTLPTPWLTGFDSCILLGASNSMLCIDIPGSLLHSLSFTVNAKWNSEPISSLGLPTGSPVYKLSQLNPNHVIVTSHEGAAAVLIVPADSKWRLLFKLSQVTLACVVQHMDKSYLLTGYHSNKPFRNFDVNVYDLLTGSEFSKMARTFHIAQHHGAPDRMDAMILPKRDEELSFRILMVTQDYAIQFIQQTGRVLWLREESLASIGAVEMVDLPVSENQARMEDEFGHNQGNIADMFVKRITTQLTQLKSFVQEQLRQQQKWTGSASESAQDSDSSSESEDSGSINPNQESNKEDMELTRDDFNLHKIIVVASTTGKLFGIETFHGRIIWKYLIPSAIPLTENRVIFFLQRTTAHFPLPPQCAVLMRHKTTNRLLLFPFNPVNGVPVQKTGGDIIQLPYDVLQATMLSVTNEEDYLRPILFLDKEYKVHVYPANHQLNLVSTPVFLHTIDISSGRILGYRLTKDNVISRYTAELQWRLFLGAGNQKIVSTAVLPQHEHIHSVGRILGDRNVLYKYLNPNLLAVVTEVSDKEPQKNGMTLYLIDVIVGRIVYSTQHKRCGGPIQLVHSENWIVVSDTFYFIPYIIQYSYHNHKSHRFEVAVLEMFENTTGHQTVFSSLTRQGSMSPDVLKQAYILGTPISHMAVSLTEKGITAKSLIMALKTGGVMEMPKALLDPRRPLDMTPEHQEEGVEPYMPELPLSTFAILSYNQSVMGVRGIQAAPSGLESTSLVFVYGLDLFFTRVAPSKMYDVLKEDFDYFFIGTVTIGMIIASFVTQRLAARKALFRAWQ